MKNKKVWMGIIIAVLCFVLILSCMNTNKPAPKDEHICKIGIAWRSDVDSEFYTNIVKTLQEVGVEPVLLDEVKCNDLPYNGNVVDEICVNENDYLELEYATIIKEHTYENSNVKDVLKDVEGVIFTGGEDISPTLLAEVTDWHGIEEEKDFNVTRDVSDYLLMNYCLDADIPVMGFCRGMQMLALVSGASIIGDIPTYFKSNDLPYEYEHRNQKETPDSYRDYVPHDVAIADTSSHFYKMFEADSIKDVPSWHHQAVKSVEGTKLKVTGYTNTSNIDMIEAIERTDKNYAVGFQFHPEASVVKHIEHISNADDFIEIEEAEKFFNYFKNICDHR